MPKKTSHGFSLQNQNVNHRFKINDSQPSFGNTMQEASVNNSKDDQQPPSPTNSHASAKSNVEEVMSLVENIKDKDPEILNAVLELFKNLVINKEKRK